MRNDKDDLLQTIAIGIALLVVAFLVDTFLLKSNAQDKEDSILQNEFVILSDYEIENNIRQCIMYDPETNVMYAYVSRGYHGGISVLYNADGTPKLYTPTPEENDSN